MIVIDSGTSAPAPIPCTARKITSCSIDWALPHSADPTRKITAPIV
jgi:hypothetical protein